MDSKESYKLKFRKPFLIVLPMKSVMYVKY